MNEQDNTEGFVKRLENAVMEDFTKRLENAVKVKDYALYNREIFDYLNLLKCTMQISQKVSNEAREIFDTTCRIALLTSGYDFIPNVDEDMIAMTDALRTPLQGWCRGVSKSVEDDANFMDSKTTQHYYILIDSLVDAYERLDTEATRSYLSNILLLPALLKLMGEEISKVAAGTNFKVYIR